MRLPPFQFPPFIAEKSAGLSPFFHSLADCPLPAVCSILSRLNPKLTMKFDITCLIPSSETGGRVAVFSEIVPPKIGPPLHAHTNQYEIFHIIDGTFLFQKDGEQTTLTAGGSISIPPGSVHSFKNAGDTPGEIHFELLEAGQSEEFFHRLVNELDQIEDIPSFFAEYDIEFHGPPL